MIASKPNVCKCLHMPAQSGSDAVLARMARGYTRSAYLALISRARAALPGLEITSDFISGFCGETESDHKDTVALVREVGFTQAFMFAYSERAGTAAARHMADDVPEEVKQRRLAEVVEAFRSEAVRRNAAEAGRRFCVLVEGASKKDENELCGRTDNGAGPKQNHSSRPHPLHISSNSNTYSNSRSIDHGVGVSALTRSLDTHSSSPHPLISAGKMVVFPSGPVPASYSAAGAPAAGAEMVELQPGDYAAVQARPDPIPRDANAPASSSEDANSQRGSDLTVGAPNVPFQVVRTTTGTLLGVCLGRTTLNGFHSQHGAAWVERQQGWAPAEAR